MAGGKPAARMTDMHTCPESTGPVPHVGGPILLGSPNVLIGGLPAARVTDMVTCVGPPDTIVMGSPTVLINGLMAARMGDQTAHGGVIVGGLLSVLIGTAGGTSASNAGTMQLAQEFLFAEPPEAIIPKSPAPEFPTDPTKPPSPEYQWRGRPGSEPGGKDGNYHNPETGESLRPDLDHPPPQGPHWDYRDPEGTWWRWFPDGSMEQKA
jgi:uncharacterized Zn-binding protein involved in type VI secretion